MHSGRLRRIPTVLAVLATVPAVAAAQPVDPAVVVDAPAPLRAAGSFVLVALFGGAILALYGGPVDRSIDATMDSPRVSVLYGVMAFVTVGLLGTYAYTFLVSLALGGDVVSIGGLAVLGCAVLGLTAFGHLVVGTLVTDLQGARRPWYGLVVGAAISALGWLLLPVVGAVFAWLAVAAFGIGGPAREWLYASRGDQLPEGT